MTLPPVQPKTLSQCPAHQEIQITHFQATPTKSFRGSSPCDCESTSIKIVKRSTPRNLLFWTCSRGNKIAGRGSFAEGPAEGSPYVQLKYEGKRTHLLFDGFCFLSIFDLLLIIRCFMIVYLLLRKAKCHYSCFYVWNIRLAFMFEFYHLLPTVLFIDHCSGASTCFFACIIFFCLS